MTQRIAPNNQLPATYIIEVWRAGQATPVRYFLNSVKYFSNNISEKTIAIFRIRENKLPTNVEGSVLENLEKLIA